MLARVPASIAFCRYPARRLRSRPGFCKRSEQVRSFPLQNCPPRHLNPLTNKVMCSQAQFGSIAPSSSQELPTSSSRKDRSASTYAQYKAGREQMQTS